MRNVVQQLVRSIADSARGRAEATAVLNGRDGADQEDAPSTDGGNGRRPDRGGVAGAKSVSPDIRFCRLNATPGFAEKYRHVVLPLKCDTWFCR